MWGLIFFFLYLGIYGIVFKVKNREIYEVVVLKRVRLDDDDEVWKKFVLENVYDFIKGFLLFYLWLFIYRFSNLF